MKKLNLSILKITFLLLISTFSFSAFAQADLELLLTSMCSNNPSESRNWRVRNKTTESIDYTYTVVGTNQTATLTAQPGDNFFSTIAVGGPNTTKIRWFAEDRFKETVKASGGATCQVAESCYAVDHKDYFPGKRKDGSDVSMNRSFPNRAYGAPQNNDTENFVALGFGGEITLIFASNIKNGPGNDIKVWETTFSSPSCDIYPERVKVYASQDGCNFRYLGEGCQDIELDLDEAGFAWAKYIKLVDVTPMEFAGFDGATDGYDVDAVECLNGSTTDNVLAAGSIGAATQVIDFTPNNLALRKNGSAISAVTPNRRVPSSALGLPQNNNTINFFSLGFGGFVTLKFDYVVFDRLGADLQVVETSFGNPLCPNYPEAAKIEVSLDGENFTELGEICLDGQVDIASAPAGGIQYIRITDISPATSNKFPGSADGYDVDGVVVLQPGCSNSAERFGDIENVANEIESVEIFPNPFNNIFNIRTVASSENEVYKMTIVNTLGAKVFEKQFNIGAETSLNETVDFSHLANGVYIVNIESKNLNQVVKISKQ